MINGGGERRHEPTVSYRPDLIKLTYTFATTPVSRLSVFYIKTYQIITSMTIFTDELRFINIQIHIRNGLSELKLSVFKQS